MNESRSYLLTAVGLAVMVGVLLALAARASAAAADTSSASASSVLLGPVVIECEGYVHNLPPVIAPRGRCTVSGAIADRGRFVDDAPQGANPHVRTVFGAKGTIRISVYRERGNWRIVDGTKGYAGLRGRGWESPSGRCPATPPGCSFGFTMTGTLWQ
jgi:hypothetical protein